MRGWLSNKDEKGRKEIKEKIVKSNAETLVTIAGKEMTVAAAIERKESIKYEKKLAEELKNQLNNLFKV